MYEGKEKVSCGNNHEAWISLLRIICMFWVILFHFSDHGTVNMADAPLTVNWAVLAFCRAGGGIANCMFVLITGYLLSEKPFRLSRIAALWLEVWTYSITSYILSMVFSKEAAVDLYGLAKSCLPILTNRYWFFSSYVLLYLMTPFLNLFIRKASLMFHLLAAAVLLACFSLPTIIPGVDWMNSKGNIGPFIALYLAGALFKRMALRRQPKKGLLIAAAVLIISMAGSEVAIKLLPLKRFDYFVWEMGKPTVVMAACLLFCAAEGAKFRLPRLAAICAQSTFGVYLLHIGELQDIIFSRIFSIAPYFGEIGFLVILIAYGILLYLLCVLADRIRFYLLERRYRPAVSMASEWVEGRIKGMLQKLSAALGWTEQEDGGPAW